MKIKIGGQEFLLHHDTHTKHLQNMNTQYMKKITVFGSHAAVKHG